MTEPDAAPEVKVMGIVLLGGFVAVLVVFLVGVAWAASGRKGPGGGGSKGSGPGAG